MTIYILSLTSRGIGLRESILIAQLRIPPYFIFDLWIESP